MRKLERKQANRNLKPASEETPESSGVEKETWEMVKDSKDPEDFRFFLKEFPESPLVSMARLKLQRLERKQNTIKKVEPIWLRLQKRYSK